MHLKRKEPSLGEVMSLVVKGEQGRCEVPDGAVVGSGCMAALPWPSPGRLAGNSFAAEVQRVTLEGHVNANAVRSIPGLLAFLQLKRRSSASQLRSCRSIVPGCYLVVLITSK